MYKNTSTKDLILYLIIAIFDGSENNPEIGGIRAELRERASSIQSELI